MKNCVKLYNSQFFEQNPGKPFRGANFSPRSKVSSSTLWKPCSDFHTYLPTALLPPSVRSHFTSNLIGYNYKPFLILMLSSGIKIQWQPFIVINFRSNKIEPRSLLLLYDWLNIPDFWCFGVWIHSIYIHLLHFTTIRINWNYKTRRVA